MVTENVSNTSLVDLEKYFFLMGMVCKKLPPNAIDLVVADGYRGNVNRLVNVRFGRTHSLPELVTLVRCALPEFEIPENLMPEAA